MNNKCYMNHPMSMLKRRENMITARNPQILTSLHRNENHPLIRKHSHVPFNSI